MDLGPNLDSTLEKGILGIVLKLSEPLCPNCKMEMRRTSISKLVYKTPGTALSYSGHLKRISLFLSLSEFLSRDSSYFPAKML